MTSNSAYNYQSLSQDDSSFPPPASTQKTQFGYVETTKSQFPRAQIPINPQGPELPRISNISPDTCAGCCCPVGTIYNHEHHSSAFRNVMFAMEMGLHLNAVFAHIWYKMKQEQFLEKYEDSNGEMDWKQAMQNPVFREEWLNMDYLNHCEKMGFLTLILMWIGWNVCTRIIFFCYYYPNNMRSVYHQPSASYVVYQPSLVAKLFFPLSTVYYHEENTFNIKTFCVYLLGCWYSLFCFKPSYLEEIEERQRQEAMRAQEIPVVAIYHV